MNEKGEGLVEQSLERSTKIEATYTRPDGKQETIEFDFEKELADFLDFYKKTGIELSPDFEDSMRDIWNRNQSEIKQSIEQQGFDIMLLIPGNIPIEKIVELSDIDLYPSFGLDDDVNLSDLVSKNTKNNRMVFTYKKENMEEEEADNEECLKCLSFEDYMILRKKYGYHYDEINKTWLSTSLKSHPDQFMITGTRDKTENDGTNWDPRPSEYQLYLSSDNPKISYHSEYGDIPLKIAGLRLSSYFI